MGSSAAAERFERRLWFRSLSPALEINDNGLVLGAGTILARMGRDSSGAQALAFDEDRSRLLTLLAAAYGRSPPSDLLDHLEDAARFWKRGDKALANIRLAFARLPRLDDRADAYRLFLAESLLDEGLSPDAVMKIMRLEPAPPELAKYNPDQPRVPAGSGKPSGRWASGAAAADQTPPKVEDGRSASIGIALPAAGTLAEGLFDTAASTQFLAALGALALRIGTGAALGAVFVWPGKSAFSQGPVPGDPDLHYEFNNEEGLLRFVRQTGSGTETVAVAQLGRGGIFYEIETGTPLARGVGGSVVFDADTLANRTSDKTRAESGAAARSETNQPQLCPDPGPDVPHGASARAIAYQAQISLFVNPQRPLAPGLAVSLFNPVTGKRVVYDDCRESDGAMIEAKGPGFARMLRSPYFSNFVLPRRWERQAERQVEASGGRDLDWFFAEPEAAAKARIIFGGSPNLKRINVIDVPAIIQ